MIRYFYLLLLVVVITIQMRAQNQENSPLSRFGLGNFADPFLVHQGSMGGWSAAFKDPHLFNYKNPASLGALRATSFEVGIFGRRSFLEDDLSSTQQWGGNLSYFTLAFPIMNPLNDALDRRVRKFFWGAGVTLVPYTDISYNISTTNFQENIGRVSRQYNGSGGTYKLLINNGWKYNNFSWGVNGGLLFGKLNRQRILFLDDFTNHYTDDFEDIQQISAFTWDAGLQYDFVLDTDQTASGAARAKKTITLGLYGNNNQNYNIESSNILRRFNGATQAADTLVNEESMQLQGVLPWSLTGGGAYTVDQKLRIGVDYTYTAWSKFSNPITLDQFANSWQINGGLEYIPNATSVTRYFERVRYRVGFRAGTDPRVIGGQIQTYEVNAGLGFPFVVSREVSYLHLSISYGNIAGNVPIKENFIRMNLGFTFIDNAWFVKRRFY